MLIEKFQDLVAELKTLELDERVDVINAVRQAIHEASPFRDEPVDFVQWVRNENVQANDYNPNSVAPPEMELLRVSIMADGYTQPIVTMPEDEKFTVVDGFHRNRVGKECADVSSRVYGYLPVVRIKESQSGRNERIASTIRHNRARGKHKVEAMSDIVVELKRRNWADDRIAKELGMDRDEILRLCQITGLQELFADTEFSRSWDVEGEVTEADFVELTDDVSTYGEVTAEFRAVNTNDEDRVFHTYHNWECYKAGFYATVGPNGMKKADCEEAYRAFLSNIDQFEIALGGVISEWKHSCEHYLTNSAMNRIAWLGQAAMCYATGVPSQFRSGFFLLTEKQQEAANEKALEFLNEWLVNNNRPPVDMATAYGGDRQSDIY